MKKIVFSMVLVLGVLMSPLFLTQKEAQCVDKSMDIVGYGQVLCCCETWGGGQCCRWVTFCGSTVQGCMCK